MISMMLILLLVIISHVNSLIINNKLLNRLIAITTSSIILTSNTLPSYANSNDVFVSSLASIIEAKDVILPVKKYIEVQAYDNARTNIKVLLVNLVFILIIYTNHL